MSTVIGLEQITAAAARVAGSVHKTEVGVLRMLEKVVMVLLCNCYGVRISGSR